MRLPMSVPAPGIFSTASANFLGMKWVYASTRMGRTPDNLRETASGGQGVAMKAGVDFGPRGHAMQADVKRCDLHPSARGIFTSPLRGEVGSRTCAIRVRATRPFRVRAPLTRLPRYARNPTSPHRGEVKEVPQSRHVQRTLDHFQYAIEIVEDVQIADADNMKTEG